MNEVTLASLTDAKIDGSGVFDVLMKAARSHLDKEYCDDRIRGPEYSTVYLGLLQSSMAQSVAFLEAQSRIALAEKQLELLAQQIIKAESDAALAAAQVLKIEAEILNIPKQGLILDEQIGKIQAEKDLLTQKGITERAQVDSTGVDPLSTVGLQNALYAAQTAGYSRDAEQKLLKQLLDTWSVRRTTNETQTSADDINYLRDQSIGVIVKKAAEGVGINLTDITETIVVP